MSFEKIRLKFSFYQFSTQLNTISIHSSIFHLSRQCWDVIKYNALLKAEKSISHYFVFPPTLQVAA